MAYDEKLAEAMRHALGERGNIVEKKMFGGLCWMIDGNMVSGISGDRFLLRVGKERFDEALAWPGATPMEMGGRRSAGYVFVTADEAIRYGLDRMLGVAKAFVATLPPK